MRGVNREDVGMTVNAVGGGAAAAQLLAANAVVSPPGAEAEVKLAAAK